jgi:hypothetical protein
MQPTRAERWWLFSDDLATLLTRVERQRKAPVGT